MKRKTFEELVKETLLADGTLVKCSIVDKEFDGKIVGLSSRNVIPFYIVECLDDTLPNDIYPYKFLSLPASEIEIKKI